MNAHRPLEKRKVDRDAAVKYLGRADYTRARDIMHKLEETELPIPRRPAPLPYYPANEKAIKSRKERGKEASGKRIKPSRFKQPARRYLR